MRQFTDDGVEYLAFPREIVKTLDDPSDDTVVLVLDEQRLATLAVLAAAYRNMLGPLGALVSSYDELGTGEDIVTGVRRLTVDLAGALDWGSSDQEDKLLERTA